MPDGWSQIDADGDGEEWFLYPYNPHSGIQSIASASWSSATGPLTPDNWLISNAISLSGGEELSFWVAAQDESWANETYSVLLSVSGTEIGDFTIPLHEETLQDSAWKEVVVDLSDLAGETVHIAWRHHDVTDMFYMKLDDINVSSDDALQSVFRADFENISDLKKFKKPLIDSYKFDWSNLPADASILTRPKTIKECAIILKTCSRV